MIITLMMVAQTESRTTKREKERWLLNAIRLAINPEIFNLNDLGSKVGLCAFV